MLKSTAFVNEVLRSHRWVKRVELQEISGAFGDVGTFLPLTIGLVGQVGLDLGTTLIFTGLYNIASGMLFGIPMGVQPMKTIASVALTEGLTIPEVAAAGMFVSATVLLLGATKLINIVNTIIPSSIVRGIQLGVGAKLAMSGIQMALKQKVEGQLVWRDATGAGSIWLGIAGLAFCAATLIPTHKQPESTPPPLINQPLLFTPPPAVKVSSDPTPAASHTQRSSSSSTLRPIPSGPQRAASSYLSRDPLSYQNLMIVTGQLDYIESPLHPAHPTHSIRPSSVPLPNSNTLAKHHAAPDEANDALVNDLDGDVDHDRAEPAEHHHHHQQQQQQDATQPSSSIQHHPPDCCSPPAQQQAPTALIILLIGIIITIIADSSTIRSMSFGPQVPSIIIPSFQQLQAGVSKAGLAQLPLTTLNSVIAVTALARELYPSRDASRWTPAAVSISVGLMNLVGCWFGALPCCHGAGGLAAQHKFGARSGTAPVLLGSIKLGLGLLFGSSLFTLLKAFPQPLLGALLTFSGIELASSASKETGSRGWALMLLTAVAILALGSASLGFLVGYGGLVLVVVWERVGGVITRCVVGRREGGSISEQQYLIVDVASGGV